jgi:hypothetical protein
MSVEPKVIERIRKLLALAGNNPNENEAALAAARAQELMLQHDLTMESVSTKVDQRTAGIGKSDSMVLRQKGKPGGWKVALFACIGQTSGCWVYTSEGGKWYDATGYLIGRAQDVEMAHYLYEYLVRELERLQKAYGDRQWAELREYAQFHGISTHDAERDFSAAKRHPLRMKDSWMRGAAEAVITRLHNEHWERNRRSEATAALAVNKEAAIRDWWAQQRGYANWADYQEKTKTAGSVAVDERTPAQKRKDAERAEREYQKSLERERRERMALARRTNVEAYHAGRKDGEALAMRRGVKGGEAPEPREMLR